jgi:Flp pilus assembly protein TadG
VTRLLAFLSDRSGIAAIEFALVVPAFLMLLIGTMSMSIMLFANSSLHFAVEAAARCASIQTTVCRDSATTNAFASAHYFGPGVAPVFTCVGRLCGGTASCGNKVTGTASWTLDVGMTRFVTPLRADACYP